ncbi:MAG: aminoacyl-tRNA hydrolase [Alphaproteobacteria bacterium]
MRLLVGLGNPGVEYAKTRHNMGFMAVDEIVRRFSFTSWKKGFKGQFCTGTIDGEKIILLKPETYMNLSGEAVQEAVHFYKLTPADVIVFHDELDLPVGKIKVKIGGSPAGHNGLKSIDSHIGVGYMRVRIGVDNNKQIPTADYVLGKPSTEDFKILENEFHQIAEKVGFLVAGDISGFLNKLK